MKDLPFFFLKNLMTSKFKRGIRNFCNDNESTSTLNQKQPSCSSSFMEKNDHFTLNAPPRKSVTLEEMILQLELEEEIARKEKLANYKIIEEMNFPRRMSCVNNSDILRSARNALNQYPRFSLDGRDAMFRSSFRRNSLGTCPIDGLKLGRILHLPHSVGGESVIWCKPGVVPKLMGLDAMPLPISKLYNSKNKDAKHKMCSAIRNLNLKREKHELERRQQSRHNVVDSSVCCGDMKTVGRSRGGRGGGCDGGGGGGGGGGASGGRPSSSNAYCVMNPIAAEHVCGLGGQTSWPPPRNCT